MPDAALVPARLVRGARGAVVAPHHLATAAGLAVLAAGGHAVDAAIATNAVLGVVMPNGCGIGGDAFWLVWDEAAGEQVALNGSGRSPAGVDAAGAARAGPGPDPAARAARHHDPGRGPLLVGRPPPLGPALARRGAGGGDRARGGRVPGVGRAGERRGGDGREPGPGAVDGRVPQRLATRGAPVAARRGGSGSPRWPRPCARLAAEGFDAYYDGDLGDRIARGLRAAGGAHAAADLREHRSTWGTPIATTYRGVRVTTHPPNSSGVLALEILNVLERFEPPPGARFTGRGWSDAAWPHLQLEAAKLAFADRDAAAHGPGVPGRPRGAAALARSTRAALAARIDPSRADPAPPPARTLVGGTIWLGVVDAEGNAVSLIQSNAAGFGSGVAGPGDGRALPEPRRVVLAGSVPPQRPRAAQADGPHAAARDAVPRGRAAAVGRRRVHGRRHPAPDPRPARVRAGGRRGRHRDRGCGAPDHGRAGRMARAAGARRSRTASSPTGSRRGSVERGHRLGHVSYDGGLGHEHAIELVDGGPAAGGSLAAATDPRSAGLPAVR